MSTEIVPQLVILYNTEYTVQDSREHHMYRDSTQLRSDNTRKANNVHVCTLAFPCISIRQTSFLPPWRLDRLHQRLPLVFSTLPSLHAPCILVVS